MAGLKLLLPNSEHVETGLNMIVSGDVSLTLFVMKCCNRALKSFFFFALYFFEISQKRLKLFIIRPINYF